MTNQRNYNEALLRLQILLMNTDDEDAKLDIKIIIDLLERTTDAMQEWDTYCEVYDDEPERI